MSGSDAYKALADPTRREILKLLRHGDLPAGEIAVRFDMSWPSVSQHLSLLANAGLAKSTRKGQRIVYSLTTSVLIDVITELADLTFLPQQPPTTTGMRSDDSASGFRASNRGGDRLGLSGLGVP
jgi:ArsR family transcriptional regulator, arsenate/arsenite/antimonite-responsive transcriptional repressor